MFRTYMIMGFVSALMTQSMSCESASTDVREKSFASEPTPADVGPGQVEVDDSNEAEMATDADVEERFRAEIDAEPRDMDFEEQGRLEISDRWPDTQLQETRCSATACYLVFAHSTLDAQRVVRPERLQWGHHAWVYPDEENLRTIAVLGRGDAFPEIQYTK